MAGSTDHLHPGLTRQETCSLATVRRVAAMLDQDPDAWSDGDLLPRGWQFILLGADTPRAALRADGFPGLGVPLPDLGLPRLMIVGRTVRYLDDIRIGAKLRRESRIEQISHSESASGPTAIVTIAHELFSPHATSPSLTETQTYIMLSAQSFSRRAAPHETVGLSSNTRRVVPDDTLLFQYSALGFNSHRIHLDRDFARSKEGFPDLVVNGGLATLLLTEFFRTELDGMPKALVAKHKAPLFCGRPIVLGAEQQEGKWRLQAFDDENRLALDIEVET